MPRETKTSVRQVLESMGASKGEPADEPEGTGPAAVPESERLASTRQGLLEAETAGMNKTALTALGATVVSEMLEVLKADEKIVIYDNLDDMAAALAADEDTTVEAAREKLVSNSARAFTAEKDNTIYFLECDERPHDEIHETVHVASAPGGVTSIKTHFGDPLNEGFTEMYTKDICLKKKVRIAPAYPNEVRFVMKLQRKVGAPMLFDAYMKNQGMGAILAALSEQWAGRSEQMSAKDPDFAAPAEAGEREALLAERLKDGNFTGASEPFWNALLG